MTKESRYYVRGNFSFKIKFKIMAPEEYEDLKRFNEVNFSQFNHEQTIDVSDTGISAESMANASLINYLIQMDEKLDQISDLLSKDKTVEGLFNQGVGLNISGSGMKIIVDKSVELGQIIHSKFYLSKFPLVFMDIFGEVVRVTQIDEGDQTLYHLGIKFLDLSVNDRERIVTSVFQREREAIRKRKNES